MSRPKLPNPRANEIRIKVKAIGLNRARVHVALDEYIEPVARFPAVYSLGYEAAGIIDALGEGVTGVRRRRAPSM